MSLENELIDRIVSLLVNDFDNWVDTICTVRHKSGLSIWTANMPVFDTFIYEPVKLKLSLRQRLKLKKAIKINRIKRLYDLTTNI